MGNIFENRKSLQLRWGSLFYQLQRLQEYQGGISKDTEKRKSMRCLNYFLKIGAVMQYADQ